MPSSSSIASLILRSSLRRLICNLRYFSSSSSLKFSRVLITPQNLTKSFPCSFPIRFASSKAANLIADEHLLGVLEKEIECAEEADRQEVTLPKDFPFEINDNPGDQTIVLKRQYAGEIIQAAVFMNSDREEAEAEAEAEDDGDEDDTEGDDNEDAIKPTLSMVVTIDKGSGPTLEFCCNLNTDELEIERLTIKKPEDSDDERAYQGPEFLDLDESLQKAFRRYLAVRGIKGLLYDSLHEYLANKDDREYITWLKNLKEFVAK